MEFKTLKNIYSIEYTVKGSLVKLATQDSAIILNYKSIVITIGPLPM